MSSLKRTPLYGAHQKAGAKLIEFGGWEMPVQYSSIVDEHLAVRRAAGLFDISHMGEVWVSGQASEQFLNWLLTNDIRKLAPGQGQYTLMCNEGGGVVDDLYAYRLGPTEFLLIINASRIEPDLQWMNQQHSRFPQKDVVRVDDVSDQFGALALQGPRASQFIDICFPASGKGGAEVGRPNELKKNEVAMFPFADGDIYIARTGYTGEDGFEIIAPADLLPQLWESIMSVGHAYCLQPAGLGARDTLRTEMCYPLYGHELDEHTTPIEAGIGFFVALDKEEFIGRPVLAEQKAKGTERKCVAFKMAEKSAPPRPGYEIWSKSESPAKLGRVVSGTQSPSLGVGIGLGYVPAAEAQIGREIAIDIRGKRYAAVIVKKPIYRKPDPTIS